MIKNKISKVAIAMIIIVITLLLGTANIANATDLNFSNRYELQIKKGITQYITNGNVLKLKELANDAATDGTYYSALYLPHIYCAQHGEQVTGTWVDYVVEGEYTVEDPVLAYILAKNPPTWNVLENNYHTESSQVALWYYLYSQNTTDKQRIIENLQQYNNHDGKEKDCCRLFKYPNSLYTEAVEYARNLNSEPTLTLSLTGETLKITVGGYFENFDLVINGTTYSRTKSKNRNYEESINIANYTSSEVSVKVVAKKQTYSASYFVLKNPNNQNQRMIAVTGLSSNGTKEVSSSVKKVTINTDVSLQKYITKVTDSNDNITYNNSTLRKNKYADTNSNLGINSSYKHQSANVSKNNVSTGTSNYKVSNPVQIKAGDTVEYTIIVYNNSNVPATVDIKDTINSLGTVISGCNSSGYIADDLYLAAGESKSYTVIVEYNDYTEDIIENAAYISATTPSNKNTYRTYDEDYIVMEQYEVSLEKYIKGVNINAAQNAYSKYPNIIEYIRNSGNINTILSNYSYVKDINNNISSIYDSLINNGANYSINNLDLNGDGIVDNNDVEIYETYVKYSSSGIDQITAYVNVDINKDGVINNDDLDILKTIKSDLNNDKVVDIKDLYEFELNRMYTLGIEKSDLPTILRISRLKNILEIDNLLEKIEGYIKSDLNDDGVIDGNDCIFINLNYTQEQVSNIENYNNYDINNDDTVNYSDSELIYNYYTGDYKSIEELKNKNIDLESYLTRMNNAIENNNISDADMAYDLNNDKLFTPEDILLLEEYLTIDVLKVNNIASSEEIEEYIANCDIYVDGNVNIIDINVLNILNTSVEDRTQFENTDINADGVIDEKDSIILKIINGTKVYTYGYENMLEYYDINDDGKVNEADKTLVETLLTSVVDLEFGINTDFIYSDDFINYVSQMNYSGGGDIDENQIIDYTDSNLLKQIIEDSTQYDVNKDGEVSTKDLELLNKCIELAIMEAEINEADFNGDGVLDGDDWRFDMFEEGWFEKVTEVIGKYDTNDDGILDSSDYYEEYKDCYNVNGDINGDSKVDNSDYEKLSAYLEEIEKYDLNKDGKVDLNDVTALENYLNTINSNYDINCNSTEFEEEDLEKLNEYISYVENSISDKVSTIITTGYSLNGLNEDKIIEYMNISDEDKNNMDINNDGKITSDDISAAQSLSNKGEISSEIIDGINYILTLDINNDGEYNSTDSALLKYLDIDSDSKYTETDVNLYNELQKFYSEYKSDAAINTAISNLTDASKVHTIIGEREGRAEYLTVQNGQYVDNTKKDTKWTRHNEYKYNNIVTVSEGDYVTYTIKVTNDGNSNVYITKITDVLPSGVTCDRETSGGVVYNSSTVKGAYLTDLAGTLLTPGQTASIDITVQVTEPNISVDILKNTAVISEMKNTNNTVVDDKTPWNNEDSDYIQMKDIVISGSVWNDKALNKLQDNYNGLFDKDNDVEIGISNIPVYLYRVDENENANLVKTTYTNSNGKYQFSFDYIKGPKVQNTNRWAGTYYSYYVVFEYDGITYTSTGFADYTSDNKNDSNAKEDIGYIKEKREDFNDRFSKINANGAYNLENKKSSNIQYTTNNKNEYIPQSIHVYDKNTMSIQSSTNLIKLSKDSKLEEQLEHINLGLRGRDIFDLELTSDVDNIKVTVNNVQGVYRYTNNVELRRSDISVAEDAANLTQEQRIGEKERIEQNIRTSDLNVANTNTNVTGYNQNQGISNIEVTYKITVQNTSRTAGTATKVTNYYDSRYNISSDKNKVAYYYKTQDDKENDVKTWIGEDNIKPGISSTNYKSVVITTPATKLNQSEKMEIYVVYTLNTPITDTLAGLTENNPIPTYNMSEISEYTTELGDGQTEYTRGLIDKDSAPGSVSSEEVRLTEGTSNLSTLAYYFGRNDLSKFKYEDDTYATPTLYFVSDSSMRMITGIVFEDYTKLINNDGNDQLIRVKTGDGKQLGDEPGIEGATVELYEIVEGSQVLRYTTTTNENGEYKFEGFLPGNYIIKYHYGNTDTTFLLDNEPNTKSYNGEDFQSTNNTGSYDSNKLKYEELDNNQKVLWYAYNESEGISTATDDQETRKQVSKNVIAFNDDQMTVLNNARDGKSKDESKVNDVTVDSIKEATQMNALTNSMLLTVEETVLDGDTTKQKDSFSEYNVSNMNFGIAEVPVTTIDLQKHVYSFTIKDSTGTNTLASAQRDLNNTAVTVNPSKIAANRIDTVISVLSENLDLDSQVVKNAINYNETNNINQNISIKTGLTPSEIANLKEDITNYSLAREIEIVQAWKVTAGNVLAAPGAEVIDVSIEDDKLQGAKLEITYEVSASIYAEKNFNNDAVTVPSIEGIVDYIDNNLSYNEDSKVTNGSSNSQFWTVAKQEDVKNLFIESAKDENGNVYGDRFGTLDPEGKEYTTILEVNAGNEILRESCGEGKAYITLEKVLSSTDMTIQDIITSNVDIYEYQNSVEITSLNYKNQTEGEDSFVYRDRIRTADRYIILPGIQHDSATSETITIHPPTGDSSVSTTYLVIAIISLVVLAAGVFGIKKFVIKK